MATSHIKSADIDSLLAMYKEAASVHGRATQEGDYRTGNRQHGVIAAVYRELRRRGATAQRSLLGFLDDPDISVRCWAASHAMEFAPEEGRPVLEDLSEGSGIPRLSAEMVLKEWQKGTLRFP